MTVPLLLSLEPVGLGKGVGNGVAEKNAEGSWFRGRLDLPRESHFNAIMCPQLTSHLYCSRGEYF